MSRDGDSSAGICVAIMDTGVGYDLQDIADPVVWRGFAGLGFGFPLIGTI